MMCKTRKILSFLLFLIVIGLALSPISHAIDSDLDDELTLNLEPAGKDYKMLLVYDYRNYFADLRDSVTTTREMFGHFNVSVDEVDQLSYQQGQLSQYDYITVVGLQGDFTNLVFMEDLAETDKTVIWVGKGIENLLNKTSRYNMEYAGPYYDFTSVIYKGENYPIGVKREFSAITIQNDQVEVYSWLFTGVDNLPFALNDQNLWYFSRIDLNEPLIFIFSDVLFEILPPHVEAYQKVYLRIEDVHPFRDPEKLRAIADYLGDKDIPFMVGLIPAHRQPGSRYITEMDEIPEFVEAIRYMQERGGSIILHGYTHTVFGADISGEGFEYWDGIEDQPLERDIDEWVRYTIGRGVKISIENEIYPLGFEAPHYAMSQDAYKSLKKYFSTYSGQIQSSDWGFSTSIIPFETRNTQLFHKFLPESLGYIDPFDAASVEKIKNNYNLIKIVRNHMAGVFYHPYLDIEYLKELVEFLEESNAEFYDMRDDYHWVKFDNYEIVNNNGTMNVSYPEDRSDPRKDLRRFFNATTLILIAILCLVVYTFIKFFIHSKDVTSKKMKG